ncbi:hypoxia inducible factor 1alpha subunit [Aphelenchoides avenae]|nr:hypoxia inducible factor 1alpha subunit [Aphelenchus avenae]
MSDSGCGSPDIFCERKADNRRVACKNAARERRGKESDIFQHLQEEVPVVDGETVTHVDRIAYLRLASTLCRLRNKISTFLYANVEGQRDNVDAWSEDTISETLDGFVLIADSDGTVLYVTESVALFVGLTQTDLVGHFLSEFVHRQDYEDLLCAMASKNGDVKPKDQMEIGTVLRMKTVITQRGRTLNLKSAVYKPINMRHTTIDTNCGRLWLLHGSAAPAGCGYMTSAPMRGSETINRMFTTRHTPDMRFSYVSDGWNIPCRDGHRKLIGTSFYDLVYPSDLPPVVTCMKELQSKGHCRTPFYRWLGANGAVTWVQTEATTINHRSKGTKGYYVLCTHYVLGSQNEMESWNTPCSAFSCAARPVMTRVKAEIDDVSDYCFGLQQPGVECVAVEPLAEFFPRCFDEQRPAHRHADSELDGDSEFDAVLQWLFREDDAAPPQCTSNDSLQVPAGRLRAQSNPDGMKRPDGYGTHQQPTAGQSYGSALDVNQLPAATITQPTTHYAMPVAQSIEPPQKKLDRGYGCTEMFYPENTDYSKPASQQGREQFGAQLAPYIPQEEHFTLSEPLPTDLRALFSDVDFSAYFPTDRSENISVVPIQNAPYAPKSYQMQPTKNYADDGLSFDDCSTFFDALGQQTMCDFVI